MLLMLAVLSGYSTSTIYGMNTNDADTTNPVKVANITENAITATQNVAYGHLYLLELMIMITFDCDEHCSVYDIETATL